MSLRCNDGMGRSHTEQVKRGTSWPALDFTSSLYLGLYHASHELEPWEQFSTGRPAALQQTHLGRDVGTALARLQGCEAGILGPSTLHLFWDLFTVLATTEKRIAIYVDSGLYPIGWWGVERIRDRGVPVYRFPEHDSSALRRLLEGTLSHRVRPIVVADGLRPGRWGPAPLPTYLRYVRSYGGYLVVDDTQALGVLGREPTTEHPYGVGGGGSLEWHGMKGSDIMMVSSLGKGFGVPMAVLSGSRDMIQRFKAHSETLVHCSPPSVAVLHAARHALQLNRDEGEQLRQRLLKGVGNFRQRLKGIGLTTTGGPFPVQTITEIAGEAAIALYEQLYSQGVKPVLHRQSGTTSPRLSWLLTARHHIGDIRRAVHILEKIDSHQSVSILRLNR